MAYAIFNPHQPTDGYQPDSQNLIACVIDHELLLITGEDGFRVPQVIEAARNSALSGGQARFAV